MISLPLWREIFKSRYKKQFKKIHDLGMKIFFHSCGNITSIVPEFHDIGLDVMNISTYKNLLMDHQHIFPKKST